MKWYKRASAPTPSSTSEIQNEARAKFNRLEEQLKPGNNKKRAEKEYNLANNFFAKKDYNKAVQLYELAAELGHFKAKQKVEEIYSKGLVDRDRKSSELYINQVTKDFNAFITGDKVNIRTKPTTSSSIVKQLNSGHPIKVTEQKKAKDGTWYYIQTASGTQGWVFGKYVKIK